jgi:hypothetical protein
LLRDDLRQPIDARVQISRDRSIHLAGHAIAVAVVVIANRVVARLHLDEATLVVIAVAGSALPGSPGEVSGAVVEERCRARIPQTAGVIVRVR